MLTAKIGDSIINCIDGKYDRYRLKQWSNKGILKCPVCDDDYEYCHGEIVSPYFRHKGKECEGYYGEPETEEHRKGKEILFNWIRQQDGVENCKLEAWIPETKQRPDIYFEYNNKRYVIEFQCTPIASEYLIRKELYKLAGINDIWILGTEKYSLEFIKDDIIHSNRYRKIEKENIDNLLYLDVKDKAFLFNNCFLEKSNSLLKNLQGSFSKREFFIRNCDAFDFLSEYNELFSGEYLNEFIFDGKINFNNEMVNIINYVDNQLSIQWEEKVTKEQLLEDENRRFDEEMAKRKENSNYIGNIGDEIEIEGTIIKLNSFNSWYDISYIFEVIDDKDNIYVWFEPLSFGYKKGERIKVKGNIKRHSVYDNTKQNLLEECDFKFK